MSPCLGKQLLPLGLLTALAATAADEETNYRRAMAPALPSVSITADGKPQRLEFDFGRDRGTAWLARKGEMYVDTWVRHYGLLCSTYEVGLRFGQGNPGCANVEWFDDPTWLTSRKQCNDAVVNHIGVNTDIELQKVFEKATCAERLIRCVSERCP
ncbi:MAG: hypothetical protein KIT73_02380 [Burkholderiales bacterium]|nr:hypothetical protein [Burkholderiales bacterium]